MPWPATVGLNQLWTGVIAAGTNDSSSFALSVMSYGATAASNASVGQSVIAAMAVPAATTGGNISNLIPGVHVQSAIATAGTLRYLTSFDLRGYSIIVHLTPANP